MGEIFAGNYNDSERDVWRFKFLDAELSGRVISIVKERDWLWLGYVEDRNGDVFKICINPDKFSNRFKIDNCYHLIGTTAGEWEGACAPDGRALCGSLRIDKAIDLNKPEKSKEELFPVLEKMLNVLGKRKSFEQNILPRYKNYLSIHRILAIVIF